MKIAVISTHNEGLKAQECILSLKKITSNIHLLNDGIFNEETKLLISTHNLIGHEFEHIGCKEPHLAKFFSNSKYINSDIIHLDYDEIISDELCEELLLIKKIEAPIKVNMLHLAECREGVLKYKKGSSRASKVIAFNQSHIQSITGLTHKGFLFNKNSIFLNGLILHNGNHLNFSLKKLIQRDIYFCKLDAKLRTTRIAYYADKEYKFIEPDSNCLKKIDRYRYKYPTLTFLPCLVFRLLQSIIWIFEVRSLFTLFYELKVIVSRMTYQYILIKSIIKIKNNYKR